MNYSGKVLNESAHFCSQRITKVLPFEYLGICRSSMARGRRLLHLSSFA